MKARRFGVNLSHEFFSRLTDEEKQEIYANKMAVVYSFEKENYIPIFAVVIEVLGDRIHVREVGGNFIWNMRHCETLCKILAEQFGKDTISFCTQKEVVRKIGARLGFNQSKREQEFEKRIA